MIHGRTYQWLEFRRGPSLSYDQLRLRDGQAKCDSREFTMLRRLPQRKRHTNVTHIELCVSLSFLRLFRVGHVLQSRRSLLPFAWHEWFSCKGRE